MKTKNKFPATVITIILLSNLFGIFPVSADSVTPSIPGPGDKPVLTNPSDSTPAEDPGKKLSEQLKNQKFDTCGGLPGSVGCAPSGSPSGNNKTLLDFAATIIATMLKLLASVGVAVAIFGGIRMMTSTGNDQGIKKGQAAFVNAIIGIVIVLTSYIVISFVQGLITSSGSTSTTAPNKTEQKQESGTTKTNTSTPSTTTPSTPPSPTRNQGAPNTVPGRQNNPTGDQNV